MQLRSLACALALIAACDDDNFVPPELDRTPPWSSLDGGKSPSAFDAGVYVGSAADGATAAACPPIDVCFESAPTLLYNVCISGTSSGVVSSPACLVSPNGLLYLAPLTSGQRVISLGWTESMSGTLSADDQSRCETARAELVVDASTPPKCTGMQ